MPKGLFSKGLALFLRGFRLSQSGNDENINKISACSFSICDAEALSTYARPLL